MPLRPTENSGPRPTLRGLAQRGSSITLVDRDRLVVLDELTELSPEQVYSSPLEEFCTLESTSERDPLGLGGFIGLLSYDSFAEQGSAPLPCRFFACGIPAVYDRQRGHWTREGSRERGEEWALSLALPSHEDENGQTERPLPIVFADTDQRYLETVRAVLQEIRQGRYYQLNLLRYGTLPDATTDLLVDRLMRVGAPFGSWVNLADLQILSFSPERFVRGSLRPGGGWVEACPIKGTAPRFEEPDLDAASALALDRSPKDVAELNMIIDLLRNDLNRICRHGTVEVLSPGERVSVSNVHHRQGRVRGSLLTRLTMGDFLRAICPAGSITGAPKVEVMKAIREKEGRDRGYFMGHLFYWDRSGRFDSSIFIRTAIAECGNSYEFAVGSGIVVDSKPDVERLEIVQKARVVTSPMGGASSG